MALRGSCTLPPIERDLQLVYIYIYIYICLYMKLKYVAKFEVLVIVNAPMGSWPVVICY